jgi:hypothetical protein
MKKKITLVLLHFIAYCFISQEEINVCSTAFRYQTLKSGLLHLTGHPYCPKSRSAKVKDGIIYFCLGTILLIKGNDMALQHNVNKILVEPITILFAVHLNHTSFWCQLMLDLC